MSKDWTDEDINNVWEKATIAEPNDKDIWRKDLAGAWIKKDKYGDEKELGYGWEIDHINPEAKGGKDDLDNLQPLQWQNNRTKSDDYPDYKTSVSSEKTKNIYSEQEHKA